jgi:hypothetical protein
MGGLHEVPGPKLGRMPKAPRAGRRRPARPVGARRRLLPAGLPRPVGVEHLLDLRLHRVQGVFRGDLAVAHVGERLAEPGVAVEDALVDLRGQALALLGLRGRVALRPEDEEREPVADERRQRRRDLAGATGDEPLACIGL